MKCTQIKCMDPDSRQIEVHESAALSGVTPNGLSKKKSGWTCQNNASVVAYK